MVGFIEKIKRRYDLRHVDQYTKRRMAQSQFESHDRDYYNSIYIDGDYLHDKSSSSLSSSVNRSDRWSLPSFLRRGSQQQSLATQQLKTSESYTLNG
ncbi:hypothetical protein BC941DRAFT_122774 [Chlamydoabsidia padenii]|nr:hypothetical protein BC941DRAFT_122774 [Chlamydoabsidia padenii]